MKTRYIQIMHRRAEDQSWRPLAVNDRSIHEVAIGTDETEADADCQEILVETLTKTRIAPGSELKIVPLTPADARSHVPPIWLTQVLEHRYGAQVIECHDDLERSYIGSRIDEAALPSETAIKGADAASGTGEQTQQHGSRFLLVETTPGRIKSFAAGTTTQAWLRQQILGALADKVYIVDDVRPDDENLLRVTRFTGSLETPGLLPPDDETPRHPKSSPPSKDWP